MTKNVISTICKCVIIFAIFVMSININVFAADSEYKCEIELIPDKTEILAGDTVTIDVKVKNIQAGNGIVILDALLEYDETAFEEEFKIKTDDDENWEKTVQENYIMFITANREGTIEDQVVGKIVLTAKQDVELGEKEVKLKKVSASADDTSKIQVEEVSVKIEVVDEEEGPGTVEPEPDDSEDNSGDTNQDGSNNSGSTNQDGSNNSQIQTKPIDTGKAETTLPKTGNGNALIIAILGTIAVTGIFYIKYKRAY